MRRHKTAEQLPAAVDYTTADHVMTAGTNATGEADTRVVRRAARGLWAAVIVVLVVLVFLIVFIVQNSQHVKITFLFAHGHLALGIALLLAAVIGGLAVVLVGAIRILQLKSGKRTRK